MTTNQEFSEQLRQRTFNISVRVTKLVQALPNNTIGWKLGDQILRSGTAIGALTEEACVGLSYKDFIHGMGMARKEAYETRFWIRVIIAVGIFDKKRLDNLLNEIEEIAKILSSIVKTGNDKLGKSQQ